MAVGLDCLLCLDASRSAGRVALSHAPASLVCRAQACPDASFLASPLLEPSCVQGPDAGFCSELPTLRAGCLCQAASLNLPVLLILDLWLQIPCG